MLITIVLNFMLERFPNHKAKIIQLYSNDTNFKSLCEDYWVGIQALQRCHVTPPPDPGMKNEFVSICSLLENEIKNYLKENQPHSL